MSISWWLAIGVGPMVVGLISGTIMARLPRAQPRILLPGTLIDCRFHPTCALKVDRCIARLCPKHCRDQRCWCQNGRRARLATSTEVEAIQKLESKRLERMVLATETEHEIAKLLEEP